MDQTGLPPLLATDAALDEAATLVDVLALVDGAPSVHALLALASGPLRHGALLRASGGSKKALTHALRRLERDGLVRREVFAEVPPRVEYSITALGASLLEPLGGLAAWGREQLPAVGASRAWHDANASLEPVERP